MRRLSIAAIAGGILLVGLFVARTPGQQKNRKDDVAGFMRIKLTHAQNVLEGLALEDYDRIAQNAQKMSLLSMESNWRVLQTKEYLEQSRGFRGATNRLAKAAKDKNLDGATLAYVEMTFRCVQCHKYVRKARSP